MFKQAAAIRVASILSFFRRTALLLPIMLLGAGAYAQSPTDGTTPSGLTPGAPAGSYALSGFDNVNLYNGNLNFHLPLIGIGGRGKAGYTMMQTIDSKRWVVHSDSVTNLHWADYNWWTGFKPGLSPGVMNVRTVGAHPIGCPEFGLSAWYTHTLSRLTFTTADGTEYELRDALTNGAVNVNNVCNPNNLQPIRRGTVWVTGDGSAATFISDYELYDNPFTAVDGPVLLANGSPAPISGFLLLRDGTRYRIDNYRVSWIRDSNGNTISLSYSDSSTRVTQITDSLNRRVTISYADLTGNPFDEITFNGFNGESSRRIKIWRAPLSQLLRSDFPLPVRTTRQLFQAVNGSPNTPFDPTLASAVELPDGRKYEFRYNYYGELAKVILPTGGSFEYDWEPGPGADSDGVVWYTVSYIDRTAHYISIYRRIKEKRVYSGGTTLESKTVFTASHPGYASARPWTTTVKAVQKDANDIFLSGNKHYFYGSPTGSFVSYPFDYPEWDDGKEYRTEALANDLPTPGLLRSGDMSWQNAPGAPNILNWHPFARKAPANNPRNVETVTTLMDVNPNQVSKQRYFYDEFNNRTAVEEFDYGTNAAPSFPTRRNEIDYVRTGESNGINYIGTGVHIRSLPQEQRIYSIDPSTGAKVEPPVAKTHFYYDQFALVSRPGIVGYEAPATAARGNLTSTSHWLNTNNTWITTTQKYDIAGNAYESTDGRGNTSEVVYSGAFNAYAFPSISRTPVPDPTGQHGSTTRLETTYDYDYYSGLLKSTTDPNSKTTTYSYNDALDRLTTVVRPAGGGQTTYFYGDTPGNLYLLTQTTQSATQTLESYQYFDGLGRGVRSVQTEAGNSITVETKYDGLGRAFQVSNPYRAGDTVYWTTTGYDALGRVITVITPDSAVVTTTYGNNVTTVRDQANKQRRSTTDGLGRLVKVEEMYEYPSTSVYATTTYSYDLQDNLTRVTQGQSPQVQTRTFDYDSLKRLRSAFNPESGTITYSYDNNGNLEQKVDGRPVTINYSYDALNRVKTRTYSGSTPGVSYIYDASSVLNSEGRLTSVSSSVSTYSYDEYDALGRVIRSKQTTDAMAYQMSYEYDLAGNMTSQTYPSGRKITTGYDTAGRISQVSGQKTGEPNKTYASLFAYAAHGAISEMKLGNGRWEYAKFNNRLQPTEIGLGTSVTEPNILKLAYGYGTTNNNGNVLSQQITINSSTTINQNYAYDALNRLQSATETGGWSQTYDYDRFGNRAVRAGSHIPNPALTPQSTSATDLSAFNQTNNRIAVTGFGYDAAGNLTHDPTTAVNAMVYDGESRQVSYTKAGATTSYSYDGDGRRVKKVDGAGTTVFVYNASGQLVAEYTSGNPTGSGTSYLTSDHLGSTRAVTDQNGAVKARYDYLPFGEEVTVGRPSGVGYGGNDATRQKFTSYERDTESGLDYAQARYYSSAQGRFTSPDPLNASAKPIDPQSWNRYAYVGNRPLIYVDPDGLIWLQHMNNLNQVDGYKWIPGDANSISQTDADAGWVAVPGGGVGLVYESRDHFNIRLGENGSWDVLGYVGPIIDFGEGAGTEFLGWYLEFAATNAGTAGVFTQGLHFYRAWRAARAAKEFGKAGEVIVNLGGEGEVTGAINVNTDWILDSAFGTARGGRTLAGLKAEGHIFVVSKSDELAIASRSVDKVITNGVPIDKISIQGPGYRSAEINRILKEGGSWINNGVVQQRFSFLNSYK